MTTTAEAERQMADLKARRSEAARADLEADTANKLESLARFDHVFTTWKKQGQQVGRNGLVIGFDVDARTVTILEVTPDFEPCVACGRSPRPQRVETRILTVAYHEITEIHPTGLDWAKRTGWGLRLLGAVLDGRDVSGPRARQLLGWAGELGKPLAA